MGLRSDILNQPVSSLALRPLITVRPSATVHEAIETMRRARLGCVIVIDDAGKPIGMFNEKMLMRMLLEKPDAISQPIRQHMTRNVWSVIEGDTIARLIGVLQVHKLRWACVCDDSGKATAITGLKGLMEHIVDNFPRQCKVQPIRSNLAIEQREGA
jgi:CBS domain-containing protein